MNGMPTISESQAGGALSTDGAVYKTAASSLRMTPSSAVTKLTSTLNLPVKEKIPTTFHVWVRKSVSGDGAAYNGNQPRLIMKANAGIGIADDVVLFTASASAGTWDILFGRTAAATSDGVVDIVVDCDGTAGWVNVDDWIIVGGDSTYVNSTTVVFNSQSFQALVPDYGPPLGDDGFTVFTATEPSGEGSGHTGNGTRKIYIDPVSGNNSNTGTQASPRLTVTSGKSLLRNGFPDWLLIKCGTTSSDTVDQIKAYGRSPSECFLISAYGTGARPIMAPGFAGGLRTAGGGGDTSQLGGRYMAVVGLDFYASVRDPDSPSYNAASTFGSGFALNNRMTWVLVEDCVVRFDAISAQPAAMNSTAGGTLLIRRNIIVDTYGISPAHSSGMFADFVGYGLLEENLLDHNGWNDSIVGAQPTIYNHNIYIAAQNGHFRVTGNISARASSHGMQIRPGGYIFDNLIVQSPIGMIGGAPPFQTDEFGTSFGPDSRPTYITSNVVLEGGDIDGGPREYGIDIGSVDAPGSSQVANAQLTYASGNIIAHGVSAGSQGHGIQIASLTTGATAINNIIFDWDEPIDDNGTGSTTTPNKIDANGDNAEYSFPDPTRSVASYDLSLGGPGTLEHFLGVCRARGRGEWDERYSAARVNSYIRPGFAMANPDNRVRTRLTATA